MSLIEFAFLVLSLIAGFFLGWMTYSVEIEDKINGNKELKRELGECKRKLKYAEYDMYELKREKRQLEIHVDVLMNNLETLREENAAYVKNYKESPEVKEAVKYAMKSAHPDNGGDSKNFMKFRELYNKIK